MGWLAGWAKRVKITIDSGDIDAALADFPILVYLSVSSGISGDDLTCVFDEVGANCLKIAFTEDDGVTELYAEIEAWDAGSETAWIWVKVPSTASDTNTELYLYYDSTHADNTTYIGDDPNDAASNAVWDANFMMVHHLVGAAATALDDSTSNNNDVTASEGSPTFNVAAKIASGVDLEADTLDYLQIADADTLDGYTSAATFEFWIKAESFPPLDTNRNSILHKYVTSGNQRSWLIEFYRYQTYLQLVIFYSADGETGKQCNSAALTLSTGTWYHIVIIWKSNANCEFYINAGANQYTETTGTVASIFPGTAPLDIARSTHSPSGRYYDGAIDEIRISNVERNASWRKACYETQIDHLLTYGSEELPPTGWSGKWLGTVVSKWCGVVLQKWCGVQ